MQPQVSVVMIFLNANTFIREAIESVLAQTYDSWELILVDDGSTDASTKIARKYSDGHTPRIRYLEHEGHANRGMSASRNLGIRAARGEYVAFLDSDDVWLPQKLEQQVQILGAHPDVAMVYGSTQFWHSWTGDPADAELDHVPDLGVQADSVFAAPLLATLLYPLGTGCGPGPSDLMARRDIIVNLGGFEERFSGDNQLYEDQGFLAKMYLNGSVFVSRHCWTRYRIHPDSCSSSVHRRGNYLPVRLFFLRWLEAYLRDHHIHDDAILSAVHSAIRATTQAERQSQWSLRTANGSEAHLIFPLDDLDAVRIEIAGTGAGAGFDVQLNRMRLGIRAGLRYTIQFRARADRPRSILVGVAEAHEPWAGLGWSKQVALTPEWQTFAEDFVAVRTEVNARIHFDAGESPVPVEVTSAFLRVRPTGNFGSHQHGNSPGSP